MTIIRSHISAAGCAKENALLPATAATAFHPSDMFAGGEEGYLTLADASYLTATSGGGFDNIADTDPTGLVLDIKGLGGKTPLEYTNLDNSFAADVMTPANWTPSGTNTVTLVESNTVIQLNRGNSAWGALIRFDTFDTPAAGDLYYVSYEHQVTGSGTVYTPTTRVYNGSADAFSATVTRDAGWSTYSGIAHAQNGGIYLECYGYDSGDVAQVKNVKLRKLPSQNFFEQSTAGNRATYGESGAIKFITGDGSSDYLLASHAAGESLWYENGAGGYMIFAHRMGAGHAADDFIASFGRAAGSSPYLGVETENTTKEKLKLASSFGLGVNTTDNHFSTSWGVSEVKIAADDTIETWLNGGSYQTWSDSGSLQTTFDQAGLFALARSTVSHWVNADLAGVLVRRGAPPSDAEQASLRTYFGNLVGLSL